ncbi:hypothetical protein DPMN_165408 [Dreissena polymorpha]|uniref:Uncharacterized protein n=1 Tax=Dreissena polymorpha TaxID=45954 RepID=A0A9D4EW15_DREPO|nr:hypothetical protein DPMN_165408 [Dreissena polymorpha]
MTTCTTITPVSQICKIHSTGAPSRTDADDKLVLFYKVYHHLVAISLPSYLEARTRLNRHMHHISLRQVNTGYDNLNTLSSPTPQSCGTGYLTPSQCCLILRASSRQ